MYTVKIPASNGGMSCSIANNTTETDSTCTKTCPVDCSGNWGVWSDCSANTGKKYRTFNITVTPLNNGKSCPAPEITDCQVDCSGN
jgi:hypothetical protein